MNYFINNFGYVSQLFAQHLQLTLVVLFFSLLISIPLGVLIVRVKWLQGPVLGILGVIYTIPSLSLFVRMTYIFACPSRAAMSGWPRPGCGHESQESSWSTLRAGRSRLEWSRRMRGAVRCHGRGQASTLGISLPVPLSRLSLLGALALDSGPRPLGRPDDLVASNPVVRLTSERPVTDRRPK